MENSEILLTADKEKIVRILYTNYKGTTAVRTIFPERIWFGETEWHSGRQWFLDALDLEKGTQRSFALKDVKSWFVE